MEPKICCEQMKIAIQEELITYIKGNCIYIKRTYQADDGDGHQDTLEDSMGINYCPFCGSSLKGLIDEY